MPRIEIHFKGGVDTQWSDWFHGMPVTPLSDHEMCLRVELKDHSAVYGILSTMSTLGITLISVMVVEDEYPCSE